MNEQDVIVEVNDVSMMFRLYKEKVNDLKNFVIKKIKRELSYHEFYALKHISFQVRRGESFGMVGVNGSGKSTLLKIIAGVMKPTEGNVQIHGTVAPMIELGAGFDFDLTARENVFLNGAILGYDKHMLEEKFDEIIQFAELEKFVDVPIKNFSSGMITRLGFSIATIEKPDILIVDEILAVGDFRFQEKCEERINSMLDSGTTLLLVSHNMDQVKRLCKNGILLSHGENLVCGPMEEVCEQYENL
ncbi:MAG: ABC transporter ATP-binding protein [Lachnospiraceae bacterium]|nr:ABC transporter ATP-binding protein [Lachnospiraceae bacterium]